MGELISLEAAAKLLRTDVEGVRELRHVGKLTPYRFRGSRLEVVAAAEVARLARRSGMLMATRGRALVRGKGAIQDERR